MRRPAVVFAHHHDSTTVAQAVVLLWWCLLLPLRLTTSVLLALACSYVMYSKAIRSTQMVQHPMHQLCEEQLVAYNKVGACGV
jgi:hypothetical protein